MSVRFFGAPCGETSLISYMHLLRTSSNKEMAKVSMLWFRFGPTGLSGFASCAGTRKIYLDILG